ncbi:MAG: hypothetical protein M2R45_04105 [Verrucomicrobia subdivision 3 bacterium]|nr:hypothetical protein [Limisphaerales bacterium]MCS1417094.1 hypothetical protein [Limisphaerales bacterium]
MISQHEGISRRRISELRSKKRVEKTNLDYLVTVLSPLLIMLLVGSLVFFLIQVFYHSEMVGGIRWVMFWFVLAIVLVTRLGIEQSSARAGVYGTGLAVATWLFLMSTHPAFLLGIVFLAAVWWSAHQLVKDCTLIDDDQDSSHQGLMQRGTKEAKKSKDQRSPHNPGRWVLYFSLAALPLFGLGQSLLESKAIDTEQPGFNLLLTYLVAACGLLLSTSFLGLRRYLRQRSVKMPGNIAGSWITSGVMIGGFVLLFALLVPRPGMGAAWSSLTSRINHYIRNASEIAMRLNPPGTGDGRSGRESNQADGDSTSGAEPFEESQSGRENQTEKENQGAVQDPNAAKESRSRQQQSTSNQGQSLYQLLKWLVILIAMSIFAIFIYCHRKVFSAMTQAIWQAIVVFFRDLFMSPSPCSSKNKTKAGLQPARGLRSFRNFRDPFASGQADRWPPEALITYSYEALQSWAKERGTPESPNETPIERSQTIASNHPELHPWVNSLGEQYSSLAYGKRLPKSVD